MQISTSRDVVASLPLAVVAGSSEWAALPTAVRDALETRLLRQPAALVAGLGVVPQPAVAAVVIQDRAPHRLRARGGVLARLLGEQGCFEAQLASGGALGVDERHVFLAGMAQGAYRWDKYLPDPPPALGKLRVVGLGRGEISALRHETAATLAVRDLVNTPAEDLGPEEFVGEARRLCRGTGLKLRVVHEAKARELGLGLLLGVGRASPRRPRVLVVDHAPAGARGDLLALCGKGVCFDTGGLDLKPASNMELMRKDMGGAATVLGAMLILARSGAKRRVRAYLPLVDNAVDGNAFRPGDILTAMDGTTVEIGNTDAEGRLILADALCLARHEGAKRLITVATLTGAALVALGRIRIPIMGSDDGLLAALEVASLHTGERVWRLPFDEDYHRLLTSPNAAISNTGGRDAGCITAGCFMARFAGGLPYAHADISPASWQPQVHELGPAGATGMFTATLARFAGS